MTVYIIFYLEYIGEVSQVKDIMEAYGCWEEVLANLLMKTDSCLDEKTTTTKKPKDLTSETCPNE